MSVHYNKQSLLEKHKKQAEHDLEIIPVLNKCDMASAMPDEVEDEIIDLKWYIMQRPGSL